jgi:hypothetical protein
MELSEEKSKSYTVKLSHSQMMKIAKLVAYANVAKDNPLATNDMKKPQISKDAEDINNWLIKIGIN